MAGGTGRTPAVTDLGDKCIEMHMPNRKGRTPAATDLRDKCIEMLQWQAEKGGHQQYDKGRTHLKTEFRTPNSKLFGEKSDLETMPNPKCRKPKENKRTNDLNTMLNPKGRKPKNIYPGKRPQTVCVCVCEL